MAPRNMNRLVSHNPSISLEEIVLLQLYISAYEFPALNTYCVVLSQVEKTLEIDAPFFMYVSLVWIIA